MTSSPFSVHLAQILAEFAAQAPQPEQDDIESLDQLHLSQSERNRIIENAIFHTPSIEQLLRKKLSESKTTAEEILQRCKAFFDDELQR